MLNEFEYKILKAKSDKFHAWLDSTGKNSYHPDELPAAIKTCQISNAELSQMEIYTFVTDPPEKYFLYVNPTKLIATTWPGDVLGQIRLGREYRSNMGDVRQSVTIRAINGKRYYGTFYKSAGDYARVRVMK